MKKPLSITLRILFILLALWLLWKTARDTDANVLLALRDGAKFPLAAALLLYGFAQVLGAWRWKILLAVQGFHFSLWTALRLTLVGNFFSLIIPGAVTGDILKIAFATQKYPGKATELTLVDLIDRIIGLSGIFFAAAVATLLCCRLLPGIFSSEDSWMFAWAILAINLGCLGTLLLYVAWRLQNRWMAWRWLRSLIGFTRRHLPKALLKIATRMNAALGLYRDRQRALLKALLLSIVIHLTVSTTVFCLGRALRETQMSFGQYALTTQLANVTGLLPVTPGGIGLRDAVTTRLFQNFDAQPASVRGDIPLLNSLVIVFWGLLIGAIAYVSLPTLRQPAQKCAGTEPPAQESAGTEPPAQESAGTEPPAQESAGTEPLPPVKQK
ncbi:MAG: flippase-like domain-containing protein [Victivallales bacterium]|nr:flippase-like domain-containing protein [Victivallales bacterium]